MVNGSILARFIFFAAYALALTACSASDYSKPITKFADATTAADAALNGLNKVATDEYAEFLSRRAVANLELAVKARDGECELTSKRCRIVLQDPDTPDEARTYPPDPFLDNMVAVMAEIRAYAQNLAALVADDSAAKAETHVNAALGSIESLAVTVDKVDHKGQTTVPNFATPVGAAVNWILGQYANHVKLDGLKTATEEANPVIQRAAVLFKDAAIFASDPQRAELTKSFRDKIDAYQDARDDTAKLNDAAAAAKKYDDFLRAQPGETFLKMGEAHAALKEALRNPDASWPQVFAKIQNFAAQAEQLAKIVKDLTALAHKD
jgi:hypothetical protein